MDMTAPALDWLLSIVALLVFLKPRFDQWPASDTNPPAGKPRDYIHWARYSVFVGLYLASFLIFVTVLRMIPMAANALTSGSNEMIDQFAQFLGKNSLFTGVVIALAALANKQVASVDEQWRATLLNLARVPRDTMALRDRILRSLPLLVTSGEHWEATLQRLAEQGVNYPWNTISDLPPDDPRAQIGLPLLRALYMIHCIRSFELNELDNQTVNGLEQKLEEMAALLPTRLADNNSATLNDYKNAIKAITRTLTEILARLCVKNSTDNERHILLLNQLGFRLEFNDQIGINIITPTLLCLVIISVISMLTLMAALQTFDILQMPTPEVRKLDPSVLAALTPEQLSQLRWFNPSRITSWGVGASVSYAIAVAIGIILGMAFKNQSRTMNIPNMFLAVAVATLGSCVYFFFYSQGAGQTGVRPHLIWLSLAFGLMATVVIASLYEDVVDMDQVQRRAILLGVQYGLACMVLYVLLYVSALSQGSRSVTYSHLIAFAVFGFFRGALLAYLVSHVIMSYVHRHMNGARRRHPRFNLRQKLAGALAGRSGRFYVKDISEQGALLQLPGDTTAAPGEQITLSFEEGDIDGTIVWAQEQWAGVRFQNEHQAMDQWQSFVRQRLPLAA